jgi:hypothetical protein
MLLSIFSKTTRVLLITSFIFILFGMNTSKASAAVCGSGAAAQNGISVAPTHGQVFYLDTGSNPVLDAGYIGYRVTNTTGSNQSNLWTEVSNFTGNVINLSNPLDSSMQLNSLANNATGTSYFLLKGTGATTTPQTHSVKVYNGRPDLSGSTLLYECTYTFLKVQETIKTASNKVADNGLNSPNAIEVNDTTPELGQVLIITVEGQTGVIGNGSSPDGSIVWLVPAAISSWPTRAFRLENVSVVFDTNRNWNTTADQVTFTNQLLISNAKNTISNSEYRATYTFRVVGIPQSTVKVVPLAQIASGTQIKHADTTAAGATIDLNFSATQINASLAKTVTSTSGLPTVTCSSSCVVPGGINGETYVGVPYRLQATTTTSTTVKLDEFIDIPENGIIFKPGSATITDIGRTGVTTADPVFISSEAALNPRPLHFIGPFSLNSSTPAILNYTMWVPAGTYANTAYAKLGDTSIGVNPSAASQVTVTSTGTSSITAEEGTVSLEVVATTNPATNINTTSATLNGTVDPNGANPLTAVFEYSTSPNLTNPISVTATTPANGTLSGLTEPTNISLNLTGLSVNTTYYFRVVAGSQTGEILSFTTLAIISPPTVTSTSASNLSLSTATLNGLINPNLTDITGIQFIYGTSPTLASGNTTTTLDDGTGTTALTAGGSSLQSFSQNISGLSGGTTYYYKIRACTSSLTGTYPNVSCTSFVDGSIVSFVASAIPTVTTVAATSVGATTAVLNGTINPNYANTSVNFEYGTSSNLSSGTTIISVGTLTGGSGTSVNTNIEGLSPSTTYYFRVTGTNGNGTISGSILNFTTSAVNRTLIIDSESYEDSYIFTDVAPTIIAIPSEGVGTKSYTSLTTGVCTINSSSGLVSFVSVGTCTISASITADGLFTDAFATPVSFSISSVNRTLVIDEESFQNNYSYSATPPTLTTTLSAGDGDINFSSATPEVCTVGALTGTVFFVSVGVCEIYAEISASGGYGSATAETISFEVSLASRTLTIENSSYVSSYALTSTPPTIIATASAGAGIKSYNSLTTDVCTIDESSGVVTFISDGTCTIDATITSDGLYELANADPISFAVIFSDRVLTINPGSYTSTYTRAQTPPTIQATPSVGTGIITYISYTNSVCTVDSTTGEVTFITAGTCILGAEIGADDDYTATIADSISFVITLATRSIVIDPISYNMNYSITAIEPTLTSSVSAGNGIKTYTSSTPSVCSVNAASGKVTFQMVGSCMIFVSIATDGTYQEVSSAAINFDITPAPRSLVINNQSYNSSYLLGAVAPTLTTTVSVGAGNTSFNSLTPAVCTINTSTGLINFIGTGTCMISAQVEATTIYQSAVANSISFLINSNSRTSRNNGSGFKTQPAITQDNLPNQINTLQPTMVPTNQAAIICAPYLTGFIRLGGQNDSDQVRKLQSFLNIYEQESLIVDGVYKQIDMEAVKRFQSKHTEVLNFWNLTQPTGYVYIATQNIINRIYCESTTGIKCPHFTEYFKEGDQNIEVIKIKNFLNQLLGLSLNTSSMVYDSLTTSAVMQFQEKYANLVLIPWELTKPTGMWYQSSQKTANDLLGCFNSIKLDNGKILQ